MESMGISELEAERLASFMALSSQLKAVINPKPWSDHGKVRVYFDLWSQNKLPSISWLDKVYFDAQTNDITLQLYMYGQARKYSLKDIFSVFGKSYFSGAKTRAALEELAEVFYGQ